MPKLKRDWEKMKMEFLLSEFDDVEWFFKDRYKTATNWTIRKYTTWWCKEKQERKRKIYKDALKKKNKEAVDEVSAKMERYEMLWDWILERMENAVFGDGKKNSNDIMNIWKIKRTEMWLPTNISKTENTNKEERNDLNDEEMEALKSLLKKKQK